MNQEDIQVIVLCGKKRVGKDTVGFYLKHKYEFVPVAFGDPLKKVIATVFHGITDTELYGNDTQKETINEYWGYSPRYLMENVGTNMFRDKLAELCPQIGEQVWVRNLDRRVDELIKNGYKKIVVTDARFQNEIDLLKNKYNATTIKIERPGIGNNSTHISNTESDKITTDHIIINDSTLDMLYSKVDLIAA